MRAQTKDAQELRGLKRRLREIEKEGLHYAVDVCGNVMSKYDGGDRENSLAALEELASTEKPVREGMQGRYN